MIQDLKDITQVSLNHTGYAIHALIGSTCSDEEDDIQVNIAVVVEQILKWAGATHRYSQRLALYGGMRMRIREPLQKMDRQHLEETALRASGIVSILQGSCTLLSSGMYSTIEEWRDDLQRQLQAADMEVITPEDLKELSSQKPHIRL